MCIRERQSVCVRCNVPNDVWIIEPAISNPHTQASWLGYGFSALCTCVVVIVQPVIVPDS